MASGYVYIIYSVKWDQYYVGSTQNTGFRLTQNNTGRNQSTRGGEPWSVKYAESFDDLTLARKREAAIKKKKSRKYIEWLISSAG